MMTLIGALYRTRLLTVVGLLRMVQSLVASGMNLMAMLRLAARLHPHRTAVVDDREQLSYVELWQRAESLARALYQVHGIRGRMKVAIVCRNHVAAITSIFAVSRIGAHVYLVNPEMREQQIIALEERLQFDLYLVDDEAAGVFEKAPLNEKSLIARQAVEALVEPTEDGSTRRQANLKRGRAGNIVIMTGGTTGEPRAASRKPSLFAFLPPFVSLLCRVRLDEYRSVYIATPIYHGFGLAALIIGVLLGVEMHVTARFDAATACGLIANKDVEAVVLVPLMLQRMLGQDPVSLASLRCVIAGGATLRPDLAKKALEQLGPRVFNLYGTSEAGFCILATPESLARKPQSIGRPIRGVRAKIVDDADRDAAQGSIGRLCIRCAWAISRKNWIETGDVAYADTDGDLFLCGRVDDMIVSGGENVYPIELERVLVEHPQVEAAAVVGMEDPEFGQRLKAVVIRRQGSTLDQPALLGWLKPRVARYQMPALIDFREELPYTSLGKLDKKALRD